ncbi:glycosyltransferase family 4 protein [Pontiella sp.]|uniref:glycosyltransferase family 4 protein n=1 Tax=Pontiella sp. TaxID=2837462 RepID=UPI0035693F6F
MFKICIWMNIPSHHQTAFFNALDCRADIDLRVVYLGETLGSRAEEGWSPKHDLRPYEAMAERDCSPEELVEMVPDWRSRIHIICESFSPGLIRLFCSQKVSWCHWSEVPGFRLAGLLGYSIPLFYWLNPLMLALKNGEGRRIQKYALGVFGQGVLAEHAFRRMGISQAKLAELYYVPAPLAELDPCGPVESFAKGRKVFLSVGAVCRRKGIDVLLKAFARLKSGNWCLVVCGLDRMNGSAQALARRLGIQDDVLFLGSYPADRIAEVYATADVFVLASRFDGWGAVLNEAASLGLPLIGTDRCGASWHLIKNGVNGFRVGAGSAKKLAGAMQNYVDEPQRCEIHGDLSKTLFFEEFTPEINASRLVAALQRWTGAVISPAPPRAIIQQPALPQYRVPFFTELARREGVKIKLFYSSVDNELENKVAPGVDLEFVPMWLRRIGSRHLMWHSAQWDGARLGACDVLVLSWDAQYVSLIPALIRARFNGIKTILWGHGYSKDEAWYRKRIRNGIARLADALVFYDFVTAKKFMDAGWDKATIYVAPNSLDQEEIQNARTEWLGNPERLARFQSENGLAERTNVLYIGRIYKENRLDLLIKALPQIKGATPNIQILIIGRENQTASSLQALAKKLDVADSIRWLGAIYDEDKIAPYMLSSKFFCYPANVGLSIMHAMGYGLPVLTGDNIASHNPEIGILKNGANGCLFPHADVNALASSIAELLAAPERLESMGVAARTEVLNAFTTKKMADGFMSAINHVSSGRLG